MRDLAGTGEPLPGVMAFDFRGGRIAAMNDLILADMRTPQPSPGALHGDNILNRRATECLFDARPLPPGLATLRPRLYGALAAYLARHRPDLTGRPFRHRSWCNHYKPNEGVPWHDHAGTPVVAVYYVQGHGDLIVADPGDPTLCRRIETHPGRMILMAGTRRHCSSPHFGPAGTRVCLPVNFHFP